MSFFCATKFIICIYIVQCILCTKPIFTESELLINVQNQVSDGINRIDEVDWFLLWIDMLRKIVWKIYANARTVTWTPVHIAKSAQNKKNVESRYSTKFYLFNLSSSTCHQIIWFEQSAKIELFVFKIRQGGEVIQETITSNLEDDSIILEFQRTDGTLITQLLDFRNVSK